MPEIEVPDLIAQAINDEIVLKHFATVWQLVAVTLEAFSTATSLQIFAYFQDEQIYASHNSARPAWCKFMLSHTETRRMCCEDGRRRSNEEESYVGTGKLQLCHAGFLNGRKEIQTDVGPIVVLFGSLTSSTPEAHERRSQLGKRLRQIQLPTNSGDPPNEKDNYEPQYVGDSFDKKYTGLLDALCTMIERLLRSTVGFRVLTINMAHELIFTLTGLGHIAAMNMKLMQGLREFVDSKEREEFESLNQMMTAECRLGLYLVRNLLSHASESAYENVKHVAMTRIGLGEIVKEMIELYTWRAAERDISIILTNDTSDLPSIQGLEMEIRRALHNVLNNAVKYSYHSTELASRVIKIGFKVPYDPGFKSPSFAITVENYGLGLDAAEQRFALRAGFRGRQAMREVPIGAGIGLSEVQKIMRLHKGTVKIISRPLQGATPEETTYLTTVSLIFPLSGRRINR